MGQQFLAQFDQFGRAERENVTQGIVMVGEQNFFSAKGSRFSPTRRRIGPNNSAQYSL